MYAAYIGHDNIVNLLLETGVSVNTTTCKGLTPLMLAASCGNQSIACFLLQVRFTSVNRDKEKELLAGSVSFFLLTRLQNLVEKTALTVGY
uniref:Uncharacterized protein n=1 Tax=Cyprinus carpio TaxID=7962 RepID=A0A8C1UT59_CYPCA